MVRTALWILLLLMTGCSTLEPVAPASWQSHSERLNAQQHWSASGKLALRMADSSESASLSWQQRASETEVFLSGPLGIGATSIRSDGRQLQIIHGGEDLTLDISTPDAIRANTGYDLPLQSLVHWLKGIPAPGSRARDLEFDPATGLLSRFSQDDWVVHYEQYGTFDGFTLPRKLSATRGATRAKLVIARWQIFPR